MLVKAKGGGKEPIGNRIVEMPENLDLVELRDPNSGFVAYVPKGSTQRTAKDMRPRVGHLSRRGRAPHLT